MQIGNRFRRNKFYVGNCVDLIRDIPDEMIDLTVTSPPYDKLRKYRNGQSFTLDDIDTLSRELFRVTVQGGVVVWVVGDQTVKGCETGTSFLTALMFQDAGFNIHDTMIWQKPNPIPTQWKQRRYAQGFEYMFVFSKGQPKTFNPIIKSNAYRGAINHGKHRKNGADLIPMSGNGNVVKQYGITSNVWTIHNNGNESEHPAVFPNELAQNHIISWSNVGDLVLDPFSGSGTVAVECKRLRRDYLCFDISRDYVRDARIRAKKQNAEMPLVGAISKDKLIDILNNL